MGGIGIGHQLFSGGRQAEENAPGGLGIPLPNDQPLLFQAVH